MMFSASRFGPGKLTFCRIMLMWHVNAEKRPHHLPQYTTQSVSQICGRIKATITMSTTFAELAAALSGLLSLSSASVECGLWAYDAAHDNIGTHKRSHCPNLY